MRYLALLPLLGIVHALPSPTAEEPWPPAIPSQDPAAFDARLKEIQAKGVNWTEQAQPIPEDEILPPGSPDIFSEHFPTGQLAKRDWTFGTCFEWGPGTTDAEKLAYYGDFQNARAIISTFNLNQVNQIQALEVVPYDYGKVTIKIRNQDRCRVGGWTWQDVLTMMDDLWFNRCRNRAMGWGYFLFHPTVVGMIYNNRGMSAPPFVSGCG